MTARYQQRFGHENNPKYDPNDPVAGSPHPLVALMPNARAFDIEGRDHNLAVGDRTHRAAVLAFYEDLRAGGL